ncbi:MAG: hypothetical protein IPN03_22375 [Holophagales bacterium]|nr:hypothetical protein [Holophagales bacterium]MBK9376389.1 hypothetical protein [Holophagales bacterium]
MDAERLLQVVKGACDRAGSRWAVIGGIAMNAYGYARATVDFDIVAEEQHRAHLVDALAAEGFRVLNDVEGFTNLLHADTALGRLDVMWLERQTAERILDRARPLRDSGGLAIMVPAPEHMAAMKVRSIQCQPTRVFRDGADLQHLLTLPELDHNEVRGYFEKAGLSDLYDRLRGPV